MKQNYLVTKYTDYLIFNFAHTFNIYNDDEVSNNIIKLGNMLFNTKLFLFHVNIKLGNLRTKSPYFIKKGNKKISPR